MLYSLIRRPALATALGMVAVMMALVTWRAVSRSSVSCPIFKSSSHGNPTESKRSVGKHWKPESAATRSSRQVAVQSADDDPNAREPLARLRVMVRSAENGDPLSGVRLTLSRKISGQSDTVNVKQALKSIGIDVDSITDNTSNAWAHETILPPQTTNQAGEAEFEAPSEEHLSLRAESQGKFLESWLESVSPISRGETRTIVLELRNSGVRFFGTVIDRSSLLPLPNARVVELDEDKTPREEHRTDDSGFFDIQTDFTDKCSVLITAEGYGPVHGEMTRGHGSLELAQVFRLWPAGRIRGIVTSPTGNPVSGVEVICQVHNEDLLQPFQGLWLSESWARDEVLELSDPTDEDGHFEIRDVPPRVSLLLILLVGNSIVHRQPIVLRPYEVYETTIALHAGVRVCGTAIDERDQSVENLLLWLMEARGSISAELFTGMIMARKPDACTTTVQGGSFAFEHVLPGSWYLGPSPSTTEAPWLSTAIDPHTDWEKNGVDAMRPMFVPIGQRIDVTSHPLEQYFTLRVINGDYVSGRVLDPSGLPVPEALVVGSLDGLDVKHISRSREEGKFWLGPLVEGMYSVYADGGLEYLDSSNVITKSGDINVVLRLRPSEGAITGTVLNIERSTGECVAHLYSQTNPIEGISTSVGENGEFEFRALSRGIYNLIVIGSTGELGIAAHLSPSREDRRVGIMVHPGATVRVTYDGALQKVTAMAMHKGVMVDVREIIAGSSIVLRVPVGPVDIEVFSSISIEGALGKRIRKDTLYASCDVEEEVFIP